tara:strand:+ start:20339 stop:20848 length:510 start_codon:yes stop_codon:yes gene_type:complete
MKYELIRNNKISIGKSNIGGRGVFASENIKEGEILEEAHFIVCGAKQTFQDKELSRYFFSLFYNEASSPEENEEINFKISLASHIGDEGLKNKILKDLEELGYKDISEIYCTAAVLGYGMIFNHSEKKYNANWEIDFDDFLFRYTSVIDIKKGEEILINYGNPEREDLK